MHRLNDTNTVARILTLIARAVLRHRRWFFWSQVLLFLACVAYTIGFLEFSTERDNLVGPNKKYHQNFLRLKAEFPTQDDLVVVVESEDSEKNRQFVERLGVKLEAETNVFVDVFYKGDLKMLGSKALLFVPEKDLTELRKRLNEYEPFLQQFTRATNLVSLFQMINTQFRTARREQRAENESLMSALPALERILRQATDSLHRIGTPPSPGVTALFGQTAEADNEVYITFGNGRIFLVTAQAPTEELNGPAVERLRELVEQTRSEVPGLNVGITGEPVLELDEMAQSQKDTTLASIVALLLCALVFIYGFSETGRPIKATICLIVGLGYTLAFATLVIGHLNVLTITFVPILIGLAIDYGIHLIARYEEELRHGRTQEDALLKAMVFTGQGIFTGALTTAGAFLAMGFTDFKGIQEMGIICGGGLLICLVPMMTLLPVLLLRGRQNQMDHDLRDFEERRRRVENIWLQRPYAVVVIAVVLTTLAATQLNRLYFDYNLLNMQSDGLPAVEFEKKLIYANQSQTNAAPKSVLYAAVVATNLQHAISLEQQLTNLPAVAGVESITRFLSEDQTRKLELVEQIKADLADLEFQEPDRDPVNVPELSRILYSFYGYLGAAQQLLKEEEPELRARLAALQDAVEKLRRELFEGSGRHLEQRHAVLAHFQQALFSDVHSTFYALKNQDTRAPLRIKDLPQALRDRFVGVTGKYLLMVTPRKDAWVRENQRELLEQLRAVDPNVTGTPVQLYEYTNLLKSSYEEAAQYSLAAITLMVLIHFRSIGSVFLALLPVAIGSLWLGGIMGFLNIPINPANIMTLPLVIGIGVTNGIHILNRFAEELTPSILTRSTGKAVLVSGLTTIAGFGSLILGKHQGIKSLGLVMSIGLAACMIAGLTIVPAILNLILRRRNAVETKRPSIDNARSTLGREEPR